MTVLRKTPRSVGKAKANPLYAAVQADAVHKIIGTGNRQCTIIAAAAKHGIVLAHDPDRLGGCAVGGDIVRIGVRVWTGAPMNFLIASYYSMSS